MLKKKRKAPLTEAVVEDGLTPKEQMFIDGYLGEAHFNATKAMRLAGYKGNNNVLAVSAYRLLREPKIAALVLERLNEHAMCANEALAILSNQARGSLNDVLDIKGELNLTVLRKLGSDRLLKKLSVKPTMFGTAYAFEIHDPQAAAALIGRHHKVFVDRTELTGKDGAPLIAPIADAIEKIYGRPAKH